MKLREPCPHDLYEAHRFYPSLISEPVVSCPGGEFLPEDARVFSADFVKTWRFCPRCGRPNIDQSIWDCLASHRPTGQVVPSREDVATARKHALSTQQAADQVGEPG